MTRALPSPEELREWLEGFVNGLKGRGMQLSGHCPLCGGREDLSFNLGKGAWQCFRCGERGGIKALATACNVDLPPSWMDGAPGSTPEEAARIEAERRKSAEGENSARLQAVQAARKLWSASAPAGPGHPYLARKGVAPFDLRQDGNALVVPLLDASGELHGVQLITPDGSKRYPRCTAKTGHFWPLGGVEELRKAETVVIAEGVATACSVAELFPSTGPFCVVAAMDAGNLLPVARGIMGSLPGVRVVFAADNDAREGTAANPGVDHATRAAEAVGGALVVPPAVPGDCNDRVCARGTTAAREEFSRAMKKAEEAGALVEGKTVGAPAPRRLRLVRADSLEMSPPRWLVRGLLEQDCLGTLFGESESYKSFVAVDLACSIATGTPFHGREVEGGAVVYVAGEGHNGLARRLKAWETHHGVPLGGAPLYVTSVAVPLNAKEALGELIAAVQSVAEEAGTPALVVVDTLARNFEGDENSGLDMGAYVRGTDTLREAFGCTVLTVHHSGLSDKDRSRGHSSFRGALDAAFLVERHPGAMTAVLTCKKMKDAPHPEPVAFSATEVFLGEDAEGAGITSLALDECECTPRADRQRLTASERMALQAYTAAAEECGQLDAGGNFCGLDVEQWRAVFYRESTQDSINSKKQAFARARAALVKKRVLMVAHDRYAPSESSEEGKSLATSIVLSLRKIGVTLQGESEPLTAEDPVQAVQTGTKAVHVPGCTGTHRYTPPKGCTVYRPVPGKIDSGEGGNGGRLFPSPEGFPPSPLGEEGESATHSGGTIGTNPICTAPVPGTPNLPRGRHGDATGTPRAATAGSDTPPPPPAPKLRPGDMDALDKLRATGGTKWTLPEAGEILGLRLTEVHKILYRLTEAGKLQNVPGQGWCLAQVVQAAPQGLDWLRAEIGASA